MENQSTQHTAGLTSDSTEFSRDITLFGGIGILAGIMIGYRRLPSAPMC